MSERCGAWSYPGHDSWEGSKLNLADGRQCALDARHQGPHELSGPWTRPATRSQSRGIAEIRAELRELATAMAKHTDVRRDVFAAVEGVPVSDLLTKLLIESMLLVAERLENKS
jgi:hypothetical protein